MGLATVTLALEMGAQPVTVRQSGRFGPLDSNTLGGFVLGAACPVGRLLS